MHGGEDVLLIDVVCPFGEAKVRDLADTRLLNQDIISPEILSSQKSVTQKTFKPRATYSMQDTLRMDVF